MPDLLTQNVASQTGMVSVKNTLTKQIEKIAFATSLQVGLSSLPTELQVIGRVSLQPIDVKIISGIYNIENSSSVYNINTTGSTESSVTIILPSAPRLGQIVSIKDVSGRASITAIVVKGYNTSHLIDGDSSRSLLTDYESLSLMWQGEFWTISTKFSTLYVVASFDNTGTIAASTDFVKLDSTGGPFTLNLDPNPSSGKSLIVKDTEGSTTANNVILSGNGNTIDGNPNVTFNTNYMSISLVYNGSEWSIV